MAQAAQEAHKQAVKQAQKDRVRTFRAQVDQAIADGDQHVAFKTLQLLRPWQPARRAQLRCGRPKQTHPIHQTLDRAISHLREARHLISQARPSRHERHQGITLPNLPGGVTFALVSRQEIIHMLEEQGAKADTVRLVQAPNHHSSYRIHSTTSVETTSGIKQTCNLSPTLFSFLMRRLFAALVTTFADRGVQFLTGYIDDLTLHCTIRSTGDLEEIHRLIGGLLDEVKRHNLVVNKSKCIILPKLVGKQAPSLIRKPPCFGSPMQGAKGSGDGALGPNKTFPALQWAASSKYLGVILSYGHFEQQALQHRIKRSQTEAASCPQIRV